MVTRKRNIYWLLILPGMEKSCKDYPDSVDKDTEARKKWLVQGLKDDKCWDPNQSYILFMTPCALEASQTVSFRVNTGKCLCLQETQSLSTSPYNSYEKSRRNLSVITWYVNRPPEVTCADSGLCQLCRHKPYTLPTNVCFNALRCPLMTPLMTSPDPSLSRQPGALHHCALILGFHPTPGGHQTSLCVCLLIYMWTYQIQKFSHIPYNLINSGFSTAWPFSDFYQRENGGFYLRFYGRTNFT